MSLIRDSISTARWICWVVADWALSMVVALKAKDQPKEPATEGDDKVEGSWGMEITAVTCGLTWDPKRGFVEDPKYKQDQA